MGYTHYWYTTGGVLDNPTAHMLVNDCRKVCAALTFPLADETGDADTKPFFDDGPGVMVAFNGCGADSYESFILARDLGPGERERQLGRERKFNFCKTAMKPYDLAVTACLIIAKHRLGKRIDIASDGGGEDWDAARALVQRVLGYGGDFKLGKEE